jgi:hypothetical protein
MAEEFHKQIHNILFGACCLYGEEHSRLEAKQVFPLSALWAQLYSMYSLFIVLSGFGAKCSIHNIE